MKQVIRSFENRINEHLVTEDGEGKELVLINNKGIIQKANCSKVKEIEIFEKLSECTNEARVFFKLDRKNSSGYLAQDLIIKERSTLRDCRDEMNIILPENKKKIQMKEKIIYFKNINEIAEVDFAREKNFSLEFKHFSNILDEFNLVKKIEEITSVSEGAQEKTYERIKLSNASIFETKIDLVEIKEKAVNWLERFTKKTFWYTGVLIICILFIFITYKLIVEKVLEKIFECCTKQKSEEAIQLQDTPAIEELEQVDTSFVWDQIMNERETLINIQRELNLDNQDFGNSESRRLF
ncbi:unnamed protein product [Brachionus calyciflorus]|uniref:Uncharacterized protein n=1 Tax=Brachionus calyciflorus TaxID=104777 RepID=A0A813WEX0_9BILA|nr:unnamed protein product [Brachionus calyciflorus]